jgi:hypothetical protein
MKKEVYNNTRSLLKIRDLTIFGESTESGVKFVISLLLTILSNIDRCVLVSLIDILDDLLHAFWNVIETDECSLEGRSHQMRQQKKHEQYDH